MRDNPAVVPHAVGDMAAFPTGCSAEIEDGLARLGIERLDRQVRAGILDVESAIHERPERGERRVRDQVGRRAARDPVVVDGQGDNAFGLPTLVEGLRGGLETIDPHEGRGWGIVPLQELQQAWLPELATPAVDQPLRMGPGRGWIHDGQLRQVRPELDPVAVTAAQDGVDEPRLLREPGFTGEFDRFMDGGMGRNAVEVEQLVQSQPQDIEQRGLLRATLRPTGNDPIERGALPHHSVNELLSQPPVGWGE